MDTRVVTLSVGTTVDDDVSDDGTNCRRTEYIGGSTHVRRLYAPVGIVDKVVVVDIVDRTRRSYEPHDVGIVRFRRSLTVGIADIDVAVIDIFDDTGRRYIPRGVGVVRARRKSVGSIDIAAKAATDVDITRRIDIIHIAGTIRDRRGAVGIDDIADVVIDVARRVNLPSDVGNIRDRRVFSVSILFSGLRI